MAKIATRLLASVLAIAALIFGARAVALFAILQSSPHNFLPAPKASDGCPVCPPPVLLSGETEQILTILGSLLVFGVAWLLWSKSNRLSE